MTNRARVLWLLLLAIPAAATALPLRHPPQPPKIAQFTVLPGTIGRPATQPTSAGGVGAAACTPRASSEPDQPDAVAGAQTQIIYFVPSDKLDECLDQGVLQSSVGSMNAFFVAQGLGALRLDRTGSATGPMDIPYVRGSNTQSSYTGLSAIAGELSQRGYGRDTKRIVVFAAVNAGGVCGQAQWPGRWAAFFLDSASECGVRDFGDGTLAGAGAAEVVVAQEILHNEGAVSPLAPNGCQVGLLHYGHVCTPGGVLVEFGRLDPEYVDVLFPYAIPGVTLAQKVLDRNHDDYFQVRAAWESWMIDIEDSPYFG